MGLLGRRGRGRSLPSRRRRLRRRGPARNIFLRDFAHRICDRDMRNAFGLVDPTRAVELTHFFVTETRHVRSWIRLELGIWIARQGQAQGAVGGRSRVKPQNDKRQNDHRHQQQRHAGPDETGSDIGRLVSRRVKEFLRHGVAPLPACPATAAHVAPALRQFRSRRASPTRRPYQSFVRMRAPPTTNFGRSRSR
jgi:hypothetical protein